ncbi:uncharacterized protein LOC142818098 isoform X2 [Rhipicephalus microplus]|uniref:uncharacterized protein LOC142818098 isoform X2 n=1 Tax=Rhipicephalus microplus TaxID=6941 RepID=UPI003F6BE36B
MLVRISLLSCFTQRQTFSPPLPRSFSPAQRRHAEHQHQLCHQWLNCNRHQCPTANTNEESWSFVGAGEHNSVSESPEVKQDQRSEVICCTCKQVVL